jgi:hypothetical protein
MAKYQFMVILSSQITIVLNLNTSLLNWRKLKPQ